VYRWCSRCEQVLEEDAFNRYRDDLQGWCRECFRAYFRDRGDLHLQQVKAARERRKLALRAFIVEFLTASSCIDCGATDVRVLEFDHIQERQSYVARLLSDGVSLERLRSEIDRCEVVCANCHRHRTAIRGKWRRIDPENHERLHWRHHVDAKVRWLYERLAEESCVDCGIEDPLILEFDHLKEKRGNVMQLAWEGYSRETIEHEIAQCEIRCCNCHRRRTYEAQQAYRCQR
jgi:hypothetical protein